MSATSITRPGTVPTRVRTVLGAVVLGTAVNLVVYGLFAAGGTSYDTPDGPVPASGAAVLTALSLLVGLTAAALLAPRWGAALPVARVVGPVLAVTTIGLTVAAPFDAASTVALGLMHLTLVPVVLVALRWLERDVKGKPASA